MAKTTKTTPKAKSKRASRKISKSTYNGVELPTDMAERRRLRNKLSAKVHREKKRDALEGAKQEVYACDKELTQLKSELAEMRSKSVVLQGIFESIEGKFGAEAVKNIFKQFGDFNLPTTFVETYPLAVSSDSDDTISSDEDSLDCPQTLIVGEV